MSKRTIRITLDLDEHTIEDTIATIEQTVGHCPWWGFVKDTGGVRLCEIDPDRGRCDGDCRSVFWENLKQREEFAVRCIGRLVPKHGADPGQWDIAATDWAMQHVLFSELRYA